LKRQRADKLLIQANDLFAVESLDAAQAKIREVLDLDPSSRGGRALWDVIQQKLHRRTVWPRIQILLSKGESALNQGHYNEAIREFESALHLDGTDSRVRSLLENARALAEQQQKIANMMAHGKRELEHQELARAYNIASEVLKINPDSQEAKELIASIAAERERREREQQRQDGLNKARRLFMLDDFDQAIAVLNELVSAQNVNDQVHDLLARARNKKEERRRQELLTVRIAAVKDLLHACRFDEAIQELRNLQTNFSQEPQITELLSYAEDERKTYVRTKAVEEALRDSNDHLKKRQFGAAIRLLQNTLSHYPDENKLVELLQTAMSAAEAYNREKTLAEVSRRCAELCSSERFAEAEAVINDARRQYGNRAQRGVGRAARSRRSYCRGGRGRGRGFDERAADAGIQNHAIHTLGVFMVAIVAQLVAHVQHDQHTASQPDGQSGNI
jgi:predicted Zn-dependent protease